MYMSTILHSYMSISTILYSYMSMYTKYNYTYMSTIFILNINTNSTLLYKYVY